MLSPKSKFQNERSSALRPPQFGLRTLLLAVTACAVLAALSHWLPPLALAGVIFLVICLLAHVMGNAIGTRLREIGSQAPPEGDPSGLARSRPQADDFAPTTRLGQRRGLGWPIVIATFVGIIGGALGGGVWTLVGSVGPVGPENVGVGVVAFAALGGMASFVTFGFVQVLLGAIWQASTHSTSRPRPTPEMPAEDSR